MLPRAVGSVSFAVVGSRGVVYRGRSADDVGRWNKNYRAVYQLDFSAVRRPGRYRVEISAAPSAVSPPFLIAGSQQLYHGLVNNAVRYFTSERDGADVVPSVLDRKPANLTDRRALRLQGPALRQQRQPARQADPDRRPGQRGRRLVRRRRRLREVRLHRELRRRADADRRPRLPRPVRRRCGPRPTSASSWLQKLWNPAKKVLYIQVGIGNGNASNTIQGDYNFWFLPQARGPDERQATAATPARPPTTSSTGRCSRPRRPGKPISPDFAGRFAADFGLAAQLAAQAGRAGRHRAEHLLSLARGVYAMAKTTHVGQLVTTFPHDYYPGTEWKSDMLWGAAEIALADEALHAPAWQAARRPAGRGALGAGLHRAGPPRRRRHAQPVRQRRARRGRAAAGHAAGARCGRSSRPSALLQRPGRTAAAGRAVGQGRPVRARHGPGRQRRHAARVRPVHHQRAVPAVRRLGRLPGVRAAAAELRARRQRLGQLVRGRGRQHVPALHAERDREPGRLADRAGQHPARRHDRRPEQPGQLRRPRHRHRHEGLPRRATYKPFNTATRRPTRTTWSAGRRSSPPTTTRRTRCSRSRSPGRTRGKPQAGCSRPRRLALSRRPTRSG